MTFFEQLILTIVDKLAIGALLLWAGWWLNKRLEIFKSRKERENEAARLRDAKQLEFHEKQLTLFYYPIYIRLHVAIAVWKELHELPQKDKVLQKQLERTIEDNLILPNLEAVAVVIQSHINLAECDGKTFEAMLEFVRRIAVQKAMRSADCSDCGLISLGEPWSKEFLLRIEKATGLVQRRYDELSAPIGQSV